MSRAREGVHDRRRRRIAGALAEDGERDDEDDADDGRQHFNELVV